MGVGLFSLIRKPPRWLRAALAGVLLTFVLDVLAHNLHQHEADAQFTSGAACAYCVAFTGLMDAPVGASVFKRPAAAAAVVCLPADICRSLQPETSAQPRAPPR